MFDSTIDHTRGKINHFHGYKRFDAKLYYLKSGNTFEDSWYPYFSDVFLVLKWNMTRDGGGMSLNKILEHVFMALGWCWIIWLEIVKRF